MVILYVGKSGETKRRDPSYTGKNLDYLKGLWPNLSPVCPHFKTWAMPETPIEKPSPQKDYTNNKELLHLARSALGRSKPNEAEDYLRQAIATARSARSVNMGLIESMYGTS